MHLLAMQNGGRRVLTADQGGQIEVGDRALFDDPPSRHHDPVGPMRARKGAASLSGPAGSKPITIRSRCESSRSKTSSTNARPRLRAEAAGHRRPARGPSRSTIRHAVIVSSSSQPTRCWRDMDPNHRSLSRGSRFILRKVNWGIDGAAKKILRGYQWFESISLQQRVRCEPDVRFPSRLGDRHPLARRSRRGG